MKKLILFDFDGTLADVESIMLSIYNSLADTLHLDPITEAQLPALKDMGAKKFIKEKSGLHFWQIPKALRLGLLEYQRQASRVTLFPGIPELLVNLKERGLIVGILSSNEPKTIRDILSRYGAQVDFVYHGSLFGKARKIHAIARELNITSDEVVYIGDEVRDVEAAKKANVDCISVTWGLNSTKALQEINPHTVDTVTELSQKILEL
jgi:phosphoglycolate phosphatase